MPWTLLRLTTNLTDDGAWHGLARSSSSAPASGRTGDSGATIFVSCAPQPGCALVNAQGNMTIRVGWCLSDGNPVAGLGTSITIEPVTIDALPHPAITPRQVTERLSVGDPREHATDTPVPWCPLYLYVGGAAWASVRLTNMVNASAARVAVWVWTW
jgi:hypothetical protein